VPGLSAPEGRIALVGDAAARHSPLTYCGFGAALRSLPLAADAITRGIESSAPSLGRVVDDAAIHTLTGALAHMMSSRAYRGDELNALLDAAFRTLRETGNEAYAGLLRDEMSARDFVKFLRTTAARHPAVWGKVVRGLGLTATARWGLGLARSMLVSA
jgi:lycopene cyclase CruA